MANMIGMMIHQGTVSIPYKAPSRAQLRGWVMGSSTRLRLSFTARKFYSSPFVSSLDWGKAAQESLRTSIEGNGKFHRDSGSALSPFALASKSAIDMGPSCLPSAHHSFSPSAENRES